MNKIATVMLLASSITTAWLATNAETRVAKAETKMAVARAALRQWADAPSCTTLIGDVLHATAGRIE